MKIKEIKIREDDGSYSDAIPIGVDFVNVDTTNGSNLKIDLDNINKDLDNKTNKIDNLKNVDNNLQNQINSLASGSPLVANSIEEMTNTSRVYVNTTNGNWYYYNGSEWTIGGQYQSTGIADDSISREKLNIAKIGKLFPNKLNINRDIENNLITLSNKLLFCQYEDRFIRIPANEITKEYRGNSELVYIVVYFDTVDNIYKFDAIGLNNYNSLLERNKLYLIAFIYQNVFYNLISKDSLNVLNIDVENKNNIQYLLTGNGYVTYDNITKEIIFKNVYLYSNSNFHLINKTFTYESTSTLVFVEENDDLVLKSLDGLRKETNILGYVYGNTISLSGNIKIYGGALKQTSNVFNILSGYINLDTNSRKVIITPTDGHFFALTPDKLDGLINITENIELDLLDVGETQVLIYKPYSNEFSIVRYGKLPFLNNYISIFYIYSNKIFPIINPNNLKINGVDYYSSIINIETDGAILQSLSDCVKDISNPNITTKIVLVGDSITHGQGGTGFAQNGETIVGNYKRNPNGYCWAKLFKEYIENNYNATVTNNGCTGTSTEFLVNNLETLIPSDTDIVIISYGTNNRGLSETDNYNSVYTTMLNNFNTVINYCKNNGIKYIINSPIPSSVADETRVSGNTSRFVHLYQINNIINSIASIHKFEYNNMYNSIYYYCFDKGINWEDYLSDGLHPNDSGYRIMFYKLLEGLGLAPTYENIV